MEKTRWYVKVENESQSKMVQLLAFSHGYTWNNSLSWSVQNTRAPFLVFDDKKNIMWDNGVDVLNLSVGTFSFSQVSNDMFVNTPVMKWEKEQAEKVNEKMQKLLAEKKEKKEKEPASKLPWVTFHYRKNSGQAWEIRRVAVIEYNGEYLAGLDMDDGNKFKKFLTSRIGSAMQFQPDSLISVDSPLVILYG